MPVDFTPISDGTMKLQDFAKQFTCADLRRVSDESLDLIRSFIAGLSDAQVTLDPVDPEAHDSFAIEGEKNIGWSLAHLGRACKPRAAKRALPIAHSLARGVPAEERPPLRNPLARSAYSRSNACSALKRVGVFATHIWKPGRTSHCCRSTVSSPIVIVSVLAI